MKKISLVLIIITLCTCKKNEPNLKNQIIGIWKINSFKKLENGADVEYFGYFSAQYPCIKTITYQFGENGYYRVSDPNVCTDKAGTSLTILPNNGKYITYDTKNMEIINNAENNKWTGSTSFSSDSVMLYTAYKDGNYFKLLFNKIK